MQKLSRYPLGDVLFFLLLVVTIYFTRNALCSILMVVFFCYYCILPLREKKVLSIPWFCIGFSIFILYGALNIFLGNVIRTSTARSMVISLTLNLMMIYAIVQYVRIRKDIPTVLQILELSIRVATLTVVFLSLGTLAEGRLAKGTEMNSNALSMFCVYGLILTLYLRRIGNVSKYAFWFRMILYAAIVLLTGSRKGLIMIFVAFIVISLVQGRKKLVRNALVWAFAATVCYWAIMNIPVLYNIVGIRVENLIELLTEGKTSEDSLNDRMGLVQIALLYIRKKPWTGYGYDCFKWVSGFDGQGYTFGNRVGFYSHNNYIELLFGGGIIGFVLYYIPIISLLKKLFRSLQDDPSILYLLAILVSKLVVEYAYVSYYERMDIYIVAIILACTLVCGKNRNHLPSKCTTKNSW